MALYLGGNKVNVTLNNESSTVYSYFGYTITYYDSDGTTVLKTEKLAYGSMPSYTPTKDGYDFAAWHPALTTVTGNTSYIAEWEEPITFATASWEQIAEISEAGQAAEYFAIGDTKVINFTASNGSAHQATLQIADFAHDPLASDETVMAGMTIDCKMVYDVATTWTSSDNNYHATCTPNDARCLIKQNLAEAKGHLPGELQSVIKNVKKVVHGSVYNESYYVKLELDLFPYSRSELNMLPAGADELGAPYPVFEYAIGSESCTDRVATRIDTGEAVRYWTRDNTIVSKAVRPFYINEDGSIGYIDGDALKNSYYAKYVRFGFCI